jgi:hypothetical protein
MNDRRFKELVNLHLDHRLSDDEAKELEQALRADPARRRLLASYATIQRGCTVLCRRSASGAPAPETILRAIRDAERKAGAPARPAQAAWAWGTWSTAAGLAAVAVVMVVRLERPAGFASGDQETAPVAVMLAGHSTGGASDGVETGRAAAVEPAAPASFLPPHLTLAALGISNETREVGVVSNWSHPLNDITQAELDRAAFWARASRPDWAMDATATTRFGAGWPNETATQASTVSFTFER